VTGAPRPGPTGGAWERRAWWGVPLLLAVVGGSLLAVVVLGPWLTDRVAVPGELRDRGGVAVTTPGGARASEPPSPTASPPRATPRGTRPDDRVVEPRRPVVEEPGDGSGGSDGGGED